MPRRDVLLVLGWWLALAFWARAAYSSAVDENPVVAIAERMVAEDSALARAFGGAPVVDRLVEMSGSAERPTLVFALGAAQRGTDVEIRLYREDDAWRASELAVFTPDTVFLVPYGDPELPSGPLLAPSRRVLTPADSARLLLEQGGANGNRGDYAAALAAYERAYQLTPADYDAGFWYATELARAGRHHDALPILEELILRHPDRGDAYYTRAIMRLRLGQADQLIADDLRAACRRAYRLACETLDRNRLPR